MLAATYEDIASMPDAVARKMDLRAEQSEHPDFIFHELAELVLKLSEETVESVENNPKVINLRNRHEEK